MEWKDKISSFKQIDVRGIQGNFFQGIKKQAMQLPAGNGLEIIQNFDPIPLYEVMEGLGFEHFTEQKGCVPPLFIDHQAALSLQEPHKA